MAKTYINTVKYLVKIKFEVEGNVDKPDIVGAIFGQSEGLVGDELDLKELQKSGKVGRIEITHENILGKTRGDIFVPSSMDMAQTAVLAAAVESVDKVGPYESKFEVLDIEDTRGKKREGIKSRAQEILEKFMRDKVPDSKELTESIREGVREADLESYGPDKLPCGPEVFDNDSIIVVEGRADVINLLKSNIKNAIAMNGSKIPDSLVELTKKKSVTVFVDGDRGGELIARKLSEIGRVDFIAAAPDGKEVEELQRKEIIQSLRRKVTAEIYFGKAERKSEGEASENSRQERPAYSREPRRFEPRESYGGDGGYDRRPRSFGRERSFEGGGSFGGGRSFGRERSFGGERSFGRRPYGDRGGSRSFGGRDEFRPRGGMGGRGGRPSFGGGRSFERRPRFQQNDDREMPVYQKPPSAEETSKFQPIIKSLEGTMKAKLFDSGMNEIAEVNVRDLVKEVNNYKNAKSVVFDGIISKRLVDAAEKAGVEEIIGIKKGKIGESKVKTLSFES